MGTHLKELSESYPMNTTRQGLDVFQKSVRSCALDELNLALKGLNKIAILRNIELKASCACNGKVPSQLFSNSQTTFIH